MSKIKFHTTNSVFSLKGKRKFSNFLGSIFTEEKTLLKSLTIVFCDDEYLLNINKKFLKHHFYTDIITFDLTAQEEGIVGEIYISIDRVKENSINHFVLFENELARVIFHGALHLCGYNDKKKSEITIMRQKEEYYLRLFDKYH